MTVRIDDVRCLHTTDDAILVEIEGDKHWIPNGHVDDDSEVYRKGDEGELVISDWIAEQEGLG